MPHSVVLCCPLWDFPSVQWEQTPCRWCSCHPLEPDLCLCAVQGWHQRLCLSPYSTATSAQAISMVYFHRGPFPCKSTSLGATHSDVDLAHDAARLDPALNLDWSMAQCEPECDVPREGMFHLLLSPSLCCSWPKRIGGVISQYILWFKSLIKSS